MNSVYNEPFKVIFFITLLLVKGHTCRLPTKSGIFLPQQQLMELFMTGQYIGVYSIRGFFTTK